MRRMAILAGVAAAALSACTLEDLNPSPADPQAACGASGLQGLVGQPEAVLETMRFSQTVRIIRPGMMVTQDFSPSRLNIDIGPDGRIARVYCG